ncbi:hypothetical protein WMF26_37605 [Sorangium sp. So ce185]|uniref:hypothetical protein n=1 Tax=Sorangium sp. So ce185 TaxID=3133287 RepID=UPI003F5F55E1
MDLFSKRHRLVVGMLLLFVPLLTGAKGKGCQGPGDGGPGDGGSAGGEPGDCRPTGCSGQICADAGDEVVTTCEWREEYACFDKFGVCERGASGECGWRETPELEACLGGGEPAPCVVGGCSGQLCVEADNDLATTCEWREEYACYQEHGVCERGASGECGWRETPELKACLGGGEPAPCVVTGCSGQVCADADDEVVTTCEWREEYACYAEHGVCERGASGECGWRETPELEACLGGGEAAPCVVTGCSGQICASEDVATDCQWLEEYACYDKHGVCERGASGECGWRATPELEACVEAATGD